MAETTRILLHPPRTHAPSLGWRLLFALTAWLLALLLLCGVALWRYDTVYQGRIFEGVAVSGVSLGGLTAAEAEARLAQRLPARDQQRWLLTAGPARRVVRGSDLGVALDGRATAAAAMRAGREGSLLARQRERFALWRGGGDATLQPVVTRSERAVEALLVSIANEVARDPVDSALRLRGLTVHATPAVPGLSLDLERSRRLLTEALAGTPGEIALPTIERPAAIVGAEETAARIRTLLAEPLLLTFDDTIFRQSGEGMIPSTGPRTWTIPRARLADLLVVVSRPLDNGQVAFDLRLRPEELKAELEAMAAEIERAPREARFDFDPASGIVRPRVVSQSGLALDVARALARVEETLASGGHEVALPVAVREPAVSTADLARLDVSQVAVFGFSDYSGSSDPREVNIQVAASQYDGVVIPPGGIFSFNDQLGWVVDATGYEEGYIISGNETQVDVGGGVCQVSTTMFRAAFYAGFEIVERHAHGYRVPYYENGSPLGFDATIFSPVVDLKFRNNTDNFYLLDVANDPGANTLQINMYGPPTGRQVELQSTTTEVVAHGAPIYEDDPALPAGVIEQVDWAHDGATIRLDRIVRDANGQEIGRDVFWSNYRPWQARYLVGTGGQ